MTYFTTFLITGHTIGQQCGILDPNCGLRTVRAVWGLKRTNNNAIFPKEKVTVRSHQILMLYYST